MLPSNNNDELDDALMKMWGQGLIEVSVGEGGEFYIQITPLGKELADLGKDKMNPG